MKSEQSKGLMDYSGVNQYTHQENPRRRGREKGKDTLFEEIMTENFSNLRQYVNIQTQES